MKICDQCKTVFDDEKFRFKVNDICPIRKCEGTLIEIDENLLEAYLLLNAKGYITI